MNDIKSLLSFDPLSEAEKITGKSYKKDSFTSDLGFILHLDHNQNKRKVLSENKDTYCGQSLMEFLGVIENMGFIMLSCVDIQGTEDKYRIFWRDGILIFCDSYHDDTSINGGTAYFNYKGPRSAMDRCSSGFAEEINGIEVYEGSRDIREGFRLCINEMEANGEFLSKWVKSPFLWLLNYMDSKVKGYDYKEINSERIKCLPEYVQEAIMLKIK
ncbi:MAG: hypothetical protein WC055_00090 [Melioribacteraceae bacterium]